jgi:6-phosphogluconate dehydrogenase
MAEIILDRAAQKGTGAWAVAAALELGAPAPVLASAVGARSLSMLKDERVRAAKVLAAPDARFDGDRAAFVTALRDTLLAAKVCAYAEGFAIMAAAGAAHGWALDFGSIASIWRGGCIIRARFLRRIKEAYERDRAVANLLLDPYFADLVTRAQSAWRQVVGTATQHGVAIPALSAALAYLDGYRAARLPANLIQAQRDYFGAHTYERVDRPGSFHTEWAAP